MLEERRQSVLLNDSREREKLVYGDCRNYDILANNDKIEQE